jgi:hypothetical protein
VTIVSFETIQISRTNTLNKATLICPTGRTNVSVDRELLSYPDQHISNSSLPSALQPLVGLDLLILGRSDKSKLHKPLLLSHRQAKHVCHTQIFHLQGHLTIFQVFTRSTKGKHCTSTPVQLQVHHCELQISDCAIKVPVNARNCKRKPILSVLIVKFAYELSSNPI